MSILFFHRGTFLTLNVEKASCIIKCAFTNYLTGLWDSQLLCLWITQKTKASKSPDLFAFSCFMDPQVIEFSRWPYYAKLNSPGLWTFPQGWRSHLIIKCEHGGVRGIPTTAARLPNHPSKQSGFLEALGLFFLSYGGEACFHLMFKRENVKI